MSVCLSVLYLILYLSVYLSDLCTLSLPVYLSATHLSASPRVRAQSIVRTASWRATAATGRNWSGTNGSAKSSNFSLFHASNYFISYRRLSKFVIVYVYFRLSLFGSEECSSSSKIVHKDKKNCQENTKNQKIKKSNIKVLSHGGRVHCAGGAVRQSARRGSL